MTGDFQNSSAVLAKLPTQNLKFERPDWTAFRTLEGLQQRGGVSVDKIARLVMKELTDNGLDTNAKVKIGELPKGGYFVEDTGNGIDGTPEDIARLFSISRDLESTKLLRLPQRGALGNGLRVVASAVLVSGGTLTVITRDRRIVLRPEHDGTTTVVKVSKVKFPHGTRIEISFGSALPCGDATLNWAKRALWFAVGKTYTGKSSPWWYDVPQFYELFASSNNVPVCKLIAQLDGGDRADEIVTKAGLDRHFRSANVTVKQAKKLLLTARAYTEPLPPARLGAVGANIFPRWAYACACGDVEFGADDPKATIPYVVEAWAKAKDGDTHLLASVNRTPVTGNIWATRDKTKIEFFGCNLGYTVAKARKDENFDIWLDIITPYMPITSDGKEPDLEPFINEITTAVSKAVLKARKPTPEPDETSLLPKRRRGRQSPESEADYRDKVKAFCKLIRQIHSRLDFAVGSRGWCYLLERHGLGKGDFDAGEKLITACRKSGDLPLDICAEDASRDAIGVEEIDKRDVSAKADALVDHLIKHGHEDYLPISLWDELDVYVEVATEKLDLRNLFEPVCRELHVPITNFKGWSDLNARAAMMRRFAYWAGRGKTCVLLLCGDHDPGGLLITETMRKNLNDLGAAMQKNYATDWQAVNANLVITRFGLNADFIDENGLTWIDNLETSSGGHLDNEDHADHHKDYVQDYIAEYGVRKCEANALVVEPVIGRQLCRDAILDHVPITAVRRYERWLARVRNELKTALAEQISS